MPETDTSSEHNVQSAQEAVPVRLRGKASRRSIAVGLLLLTVVLMAVLPPLVNVNRFKRRIVTSISASLGRPVHLDRVSLVLLPLPGFKLENFVVAEDETFGAEPVIHANNVQATLRFDSLWRRKVEFSRISLREPSINLVHNSQGKWNVEGILFQAAQISAAPTAQAKAGPEPRFPYIEATDARVNVKEGNEKLPFSLTEADFALWLPSPNRWRVRVQGKPTRTDTSASDTGRVSFEGSLGRAERLDLIPIDLSAEWRNVPLGEASRVVTGRDAGLRGELRLNLRVTGTVGASLIKAAVDLRNARKADFVPEQPLDLRLECQAESASTFHTFHQVRCSWPPPAAPAFIALTGDIPEIARPETAAFEIGTPGLPASVLLSWLRISSPRVPEDLVASGTVTGSISASAAGVKGQLQLRDFALTGGVLGEAPIMLEDTTLASGAVGKTEKELPKNSHKIRLPGTAPPAMAEFVMAPAKLDLGGKEVVTLEGRFNRTGYTLHLVGTTLPSRLLTLATALPQFGDGLASLLRPSAKEEAPREPPVRVEAPVHVDLTSTRQWSGGQTWSRTVAAPAKPKPQKHT